MNLAAQRPAEKPTYPLPHTPSPPSCRPVSLALVSTQTDPARPAEHAPDKVLVAPKSSQPGKPSFKRTFDICLAILTLPAVLPVIAILWALVRLDGAPGFFGHRRVGQRGREFTCWKLRTMCADADQRLASHLHDNADAMGEWAATFKLIQDPRITRFGRFLRSSSLDELPQVWNVLRGDMSFVGPRPVPAAELRMYGRAQASYLALRPGITGLWQVRGRNDVSYQTRVAMDVLYRRNASIWLDIKIIILTFAVVLRRTGK